jgi:putative exosortase-associated protein (TIGR04073 family)
MRIIALTLALVLAAPIAAQAASGSERPYPIKIIWKFGRGVTNVVLSPMEIVTNGYLEGTRAHLDGGTLGDEVNGVFTGGVTGIGFMAARIGVGVFDVFTFPIPSRPVMQPGTPGFFLETILDEREPTSIMDEAPSDNFPRQVD